MTPEQIFTEICAEVGVEVNGGRPWDIQVHRANFFDRVVADGSLGLGETYMWGWWDSEDLLGFFERLLASKKIVKWQHVGWRAALAKIRARLRNVQTVAQSRQLADAHYNLDNALFEKMLGRSMTYSCGYWRNVNNLDDAQDRKHDLISRKLCLSEGDRILDIGCGWGGFANFAACRHDCEVVGITVAREQFEYAQRFCSGLPVDILCCDYREFDSERHTSSFDKIVSVGMIEHVGLRNYRNLMEMSYRVLRPEGLFLLQTIGSNESTLTSDPWISKYIFPGCKIPSLKQIAKSVEGIFTIQGVQNIGLHYSQTLEAWHDNFVEYWRDQQARGQSTDCPVSSEYFYRMWRYYLLISSANFKLGGSQVWQIVFSKGPVGRAR